MNGALLAIIVGTFLAGMGIALVIVVTLIERFTPEPGPKDGDTVPCPGLPKCPVNFPHVHTIEVVEYIDDVIEGAEQ